MLGELAVRFIAGGAIVVAFSIIGDVLRPKSFSGIFGAAPSIAVATLALGFASKGGSYVGLEGRSMIAGAAGLFAYSLVAAWLLLGGRMGSFAGAGAALLAWFAVAFGIWGAALR